MALTIHITFSVGWIGAVFTYLVLVAVAMTSQGDLLVIQALNVYKPAGIIVFGTGTH